MATKLYDLRRNVAIAAGSPGLTFDPLLMEPIGGVDTLVPPDLVIPVPKAAAASAAVTSALAVGNIVIDHNEPGPAATNFDVLSIRLHTMQRSVLAAANKYANIQLATAIAGAGAGTDINPLLTRSGVAVAPTIAIPVPKVVPTLATTQSWVQTAMATGNINVRSSEVGAVNNDVLMLVLQSFQDLQAAVIGTNRDQRRYFVIADVGPDASVGAVYEDDDDTTRQFRVDRAKVSGDGSTLLWTTQIAGATSPTAGGLDNLSLVRGTGDANIAYTDVYFEKYMEMRSNVAVPNGAGGLTYNPRLCENGVLIMPDIVIPVPKAVNTVPYVPTNLAGAVGNVVVEHNGGAPVNHDILYLRAHSIFRDI